MKIVIDTKKPRSKTIPGPIVVIPQATWQSTSWFTDIPISITNPYDKPIYINIIPSK